jgi:CheY-like chemotaxis protein
MKELDILMPNVDGLTTIRRIRETPRLKNVRALALTASAMLGDRDLFLESGFDAYLTKPFDPDVLLNEMRRLLGP